MKIKIQDETAHIIPQGSINLNNASDLENKFKKAIEKDVYNITLNMKKVNDIDSMAMGKILILQRKIKREDGKIIIKNINSENVKEALEIVNLDEVVEIKD